jgi:hypothetical protein
MKKKQENTLKIDPATIAMFEQLAHEHRTASFALLIDELVCESAQRLPDKISLSNADDWANTLSEALAAMICCCAREPEPQRPDWLEHLMRALSSRVKQRAQEHRAWARRNS